VNLDEEDSINSVLNAIERNKTVAPKVHLRLRAKFGGRASVQLTHSQALRLVRMVKSSFQENLQWSADLQIAVVSESPELRFCLMELAPLFSKIEVWLHYISASNGPLAISIAYALQEALKPGVSCLQDLSVKNCILGRESIYLLGQGLQHNSCLLRRLYLDDVEIDSSYFENHEERRTINPFALGLARNSTLEEVRLWPTLDSTQDITFFDLFREIVTLDQPPKWQKFSWKTNTLGHTIATRSVGDLPLVDYFTRTLAHQKCQIVDLNLDQCFLGFHHSSYERDILRSLMLGLQENASIQVLSLNHNGFDVVDLQCIMDGISSGRCRENLRQVYLVEFNRWFRRRNYESLDWLIHSSLLQPHPSNSQLRKLWIANHLPNNRVLDDDGDNEESTRRGYSNDELEAVILRLLEQNPCLHDLGDDLMIRKRMPKVSDLLDLNKCFGPLRLPSTQVKGPKRGDESPLSHLPIPLWPLVLGRTNKQLKEHPTRCANVIHHILKSAPGLLES